MNKARQDEAKYFVKLNIAYNLEDYFSHKNILCFYINQILNRLVKKNSLKECIKFLTDHFGSLEKF